MQADLWTFAVNLYQRPHVAQRCLLLQDHGANVCLLLCAAWLEQRSVACTPERLAALVATAARWSTEVVVPLRDLRLQWRDTAQHDALLAQLREAIKALELQAERILLERLDEVGEHWPASAQATPWLEAVLPGRVDPTVTDICNALQGLRAAAPDA